MDYKIIDCHAHIFPPAAGASGFPDVATHLLHQQRAMHMHGNQPYRRLRDDAIITEKMLWDANDPSPKGRANVNFRVGKFGRFEWNKDNEDYYVQFLPPWMEDLSMLTDRFVAMMHYANITTAVLQNDHIYGNLSDMFAQAMTNYPGKFIGTAQVEEAFAYQDSEISRLNDQIQRQKMSALYFTTTGMFRSGYKPMHSDPVYDPFWREVEKLAIPVLWVQSTNSPVGSYEDELCHLEKIMTRFPNIRHVLVHGIPTAIYADERNILKLPSIVTSLMQTGLVSAEILYPIAWGKTYDYPYNQAHNHIQQLIEMFGAGRFMWGSDGPNVDRYCTYAQSLTYFTQYANYLDEAERKLILHDNAFAIFNAIPTKDTGDGN